ncbi:eotaxin-like [Clarias gariepinus]|uniref:eotaxin-like n=1 Tax=Clarias gariepinus TaxID=13013 RepID=UPI00234D6861|nr:eotaxin-like [Clarias gariepinus]
MKTSRVFLVLGFVLIVAFCSDAGPPTLPVSCCFNFFTGKIPPQNIQAVKPTDTQCPQKGFIVSTLKVLSLCVRDDPSVKKETGKLL